MPTAPAGGRGLAPPLAPHVHQHHIRASEDKPDRVVLLAPAVQRETHWLPARGGERARTVPCKGDACVWCPKVEVRVNWYAPALLAVESDPAGPTAWSRVVLYIPHKALKWFTNVRGAAHHAWCRLNQGDRGTRVFAKCVTLCHQVDEPSFDVQPVLDLVWGIEGGADAVRRLREKLSPSVLPPIFVRPRPEPDGVKELSNKVDQLQEVVLNQKATIDEMIRLGKWGGTRKKVDDEVVNEVKNKLIVRGKTIAQHEADGTSRPGTNHSEGGDQ